MTDGYDEDQNGYHIMQSPLKKRRISLNQGPETASPALLLPESSPDYLTQGARAITTDQACEDDDNGDISFSANLQQMRQTVTPFTAHHTPERLEKKPQSDPNSKYCYRHEPKLKCRRGADEPSMKNLQKVSTVSSRDCNHTDCLSGTGSAV